MATADAQKRAAGEAAALEVHNGMTVGLGTGSTAAWFIRALAARGLPDLRCVPTSEATADLARDLGLPLTTLDELPRLDLTVDGADEIAPDLSLIKGGGGALLREKLVWEASDRCLVIADEAKLAETLGAFPLPVEVTPFGHATTATRIAAVVEVQPVLRMANDSPFVTDGGNLIYDVPLGRIDDPDWLHMSLSMLTGVVDHGLFLGLADEALIGRADGVEPMIRPTVGDR